MLTLLGASSAVRRPEDIPRAPARPLRSGRRGDFFRGLRGPSRASARPKRAPLGAHTLLPAAATDERPPGRGLLVALERRATRLGTVARLRHWRRDPRALCHCEP